MRNSPESKTSLRAISTYLPSAFATREIVIAHSPSAGPVTALRNTIILASFAALKAHGHYERYTELIASEDLEQLLAASLAPGWIPIGLADAHYRTCDQLSLQGHEFDAIGRSAGDRVQAAVLVTSAKRARASDFDLWDAVGSLHRMWARLFQGGSVQVSKLGPKDQLVEERGHSLNRYHYYRQAHLAAVSAAYEALGGTTKVSIASYDPATDDMSVRIVWN